MDSTAREPAPLSQTVSLLATARSLKQVTRVVTEAARESTHAFGATFLVAEGGDCVCIDECAPRTLWKGKHLPVEASASGWAISHAETLVVPDVRADERVATECEIVGVSSLCATPIRASAPMGAIVAYWREPHVPTDEEIQELEVLANSAAVAMVNLDLRAANVRREEERDRAEARSDDLEQALQQMVHDMRSPLSAMMGYAELIGDEFDTDPHRARAYVDDVLRCGRRMAAQIDRTLGLVRVTGQQPEPQLVDLSAAARSVADDLTADLTDREVHVEVEPGIEVIADPVLLRVLLQNLIGNAVKYSSHEPVTRVCIHRAAAASTDHTMTTIEVRDNGAGFDPGRAHELFRPLHRLHDDGEFAGTGLGLASVARIVARHGGTVSAEGRPGHGASFFFSLPSA